MPYRTRTLAKLGHECSMRQAELPSKSEAPEHERRDDNRSHHLTKR